MGSLVAAAAGGSRVAGLDSSRSGGAGPDLMSTGGLLATVGAGRGTVSFHAVTGVSKASAAAAPMAKTLRMVSVVRDAPPVRVQHLAHFGHVVGCDAGGQGLRGDDVDEQRELGVGDAHVAVHV